SHRLGVLASVFLLAAMLFYSVVFLEFFGAFLLLYWLVRDSLTARNVLIIVASYFFYAWWTPASTADSGEAGSRNGLLGLLWQCRFLGLLLLTSLVDFSVGLGLEKLRGPGARKALLAVSIVVNLGVLGFFKYANFFAGTVASLLGQLGLTVRASLLDVVLPAGISFYTFQSMSYAIDVYRRMTPATRNLIRFLAFVSFFPQL